MLQSADNSIGTNIMKPHKKGNIFIISAASGTGKTTLVSRLLKNNGDLRVPASRAKASGTACIIILFPKKNLNP